MAHAKATKTTVCIDEELMKDAIAATGANSKRQAIEKGLKLLVKRSSSKAFIDELGSFDIDLTPEILERLRDEQ
jgi:Arc/MetJ family transcription regulator